MIVVDYNKCTGCSACYNACSQGAITMDEHEGFYYPKVDLNKCTHCNLCIKVCPIEDSINQKYPVGVYAVWAKDNDLRSKSSSGGLFGVLARYILSNNGVIYGAKYDDNFLVIHDRIDSLENLDKLHGSKYVQSDIGFTMKSVKEDLETGKLVLFSGTPCQIDGLNHFLDKKYENLMRIDFVCHGVPSPIVYKDYLKYMENRYHSPIVKINFRAKTEEKSQNLSIKFKNGEEYYLKQPLEDWYFYGFATSILSRESCLKCKYISFAKKSDITVGDFWGLDKDFMKEKGLDNHPSLLLVNSDKGNKLFDCIKSDVVYHDRKLEEAIAGNRNLRLHNKRPIHRDKFLKNYCSEQFEAQAHLYLTYRLSINDYIKKLLGRKITKWIIKVLKR